MTLARLRYELVLGPWANLIEDHHGVLAVRLRWQRALDERDAAEAVDATGAGTLGGVASDAVRPALAAPAAAHGVRVKVVEEPGVAVGGGVGRKVAARAHLTPEGVVCLRRVRQLHERRQRLLRRQQLRLLLRGALPDERRAVHVDGHDEDGRVHRPRLVLELVLEARLELVQLHQRVLWQRNRTQLLFLLPLKCEIHSVQPQVCKYVSPSNPYS